MKNLLALPAVLDRHRRRRRSRRCCRCGSSAYLLGILTVAYYFGVFSMAWDLLFGFAGEVNFGPTFLIGLGAYTAAILDNQFGPPIFVCVLAGAVVAVRRRAAAGGAGAAAAAAPISASSRWSPCCCCRTPSSSSRTGPAARSA